MMADYVDDAIVTCGECGLEYRRDVNILTGDPIYVKPKKCTHSPSKVLINGEPPATVKEGSK